MLLEGDGRPKKTPARWTRLSLRSKGVVVLTIPLAALIVAQLAIYRVEGDVASVDRRVVRFYDSRAALSQLRVSLSGAQAAAGERQFSVAFDQARETAEKALARLAALARGTADQEAVAVIRHDAEQELSILNSLRQAPDANTGPARLNRAKAAMTEALAASESLSDGQERHFAESVEEREAARHRLFTTLMACGILGPLGALFMNLVVAGRLSQRIAAVSENARRLAHGLPLEPFRGGSDEISSLAQQIEDAAYLLRKREREVKENEQRYRDLFDRAPIAFEETDRDGMIRRFNQAVCNLLKCPPDQILGRKAWEFVAPDQQETFRHAMTERIATGTESGAFECDYMLDDGSRITVEIRENLIRGDSGDVIGVVCSLLDVTERNLAAVAARKVSQYAMELRNKNEQLARALEAARLATEAKSRFLAGVSHELRTPLNGIIGFSELMYDAKLGPVSEDHKDVLSDILTSARHLLQLINDILDLSKVEAGRMEFHPESTRIDTIVYEVRDVVRPLAEKKHLKLSISVPPEFTAVVDPARFKQVLYNYLSNAVKFTPENGRVEVRIRREEDHSFRVEVEDTGVGISPEEIAKLFQEFQQLPNSRKAEQGTGLGLALTRHIVEAQGGSVSVRSVMGTGSVFTAVFPLVSIPISDGVAR
ncbi:MAG TPA: PAS domain-containing sensor histidine kinase [Bryobacteraceae bacterium]|jgi:PAS domain S-box-containing protein|nr:PAS domain-containing sensor histidine kinase [Bryobacteraceae bacterium]